MKNLLNIVLLVFIVVLLPAQMGCPNPETGKVDPYLTARTIILQANTALALADGIFHQWLLGQTSTDQLMEKQATYAKVKTGVANGLQLALNGVAIAQQAKEDPDIKKLMAEANGAWINLRKFIEDLLAPSPAPSTQPATKVASDTKKEALPLRAKLKVLKKPNLKNLPKTLIPTS